MKEAKTTRKIGINFEAHIDISDDRLLRTAYLFNGMQGNEYRKFAVVINKLTDRCMLVIEDIGGFILDQRSFHVTPHLGEWDDIARSHFLANDDSNAIGAKMAFAFKPMLLKLGLMLVPGNIFYEVRKSLNLDLYLFSNNNRKKKKG